MTEALARGEIGTRADPVSDGLETWTDPEPHTGKARELPLIIALVAIAAIETAVTHLVVQSFSPRAAWLLTSLSLAFVGLVLRLAWLVTRHPVRFVGARLTVQVGLGRELCLSVEHLTPCSAGAVPNGGGTLRTASLVGSNCCLIIDPPILVARRRGTPRAGRIELSIDDVAAFARELARRKALVRVTNRVSAPQPTGD